MVGEETIDAIEKVKKEANRVSKTCVTFLAVELLPFQENRISQSPLLACWRSYAQRTNEFGDVKTVYSVISNHSAN